MSDKIRDEFEKFLRMVDIGRDRSGFMPLTASEVKVLEYGFSGGWKAALAQQPAQAVPDGYLLLTHEQLGKHSLTALECAPQSRVMLISSIKRLSDKNTLAAPAAPVAPQAPVAYLTIDAEGICALSVGRISKDSRPLYTAPPAAEQPNAAVMPCGAVAANVYEAYEAGKKAAENPTGTTSDKYRAELYDEVWEKARGMGYGNVTNALVELERTKAAEQPDSVKVPRETLSLIAYALHGSGWFVLHRKLRALLAGGEA